MRDQEKIHAKEMKSAVEEGLSQCKSVKCRLESEHKRDVTALVLEHDNSLTKIKTKDGCSSQVKHFDPHEGLST